MFRYSLDYLQEISSQPPNLPPQLSTDEAMVGGGVYMLQANMQTLSVSGVAHIGESADVPDLDVDFLRMKNAPT